MINLPDGLTLSPRPTTADHDPVQDDEWARAVTVLARDVRLGDTVLATFPTRLRSPATGAHVGLHTPSPYWADPEPALTPCHCTACQIDGLGVDGGRHLIRLANSVPFGACDILPPDTYVLIAPHTCACGCDTALADRAAYDWTSAESVQHLMETGRPLRPGEALTPTAD
ncbi:hypothetical protein [Streptomyces yangpuensis]|uniref:hypothetical protein n=1 Tax=Streptomyces yangpuensis TaxID=1648182 RepID=UPI00364629E7